MLTSIKELNVVQVPMTLFRRNSAPYTDPFIFEWLWSLPDQNFQKRKCLTNYMYHFERLSMSCSFVALTRRAFVQTPILPFFSNTEKQHIEVV